MTAIKFLWFSLIALADLFIVIAFVSAFVGLSKAWVRDWVRIYFEENEAFLRRLGSVSHPHEVRSRFDS